MSISLIHFDEYGKGMGYPSMKKSFSDKPYCGKAKIVRYLRNGRKTFMATSRAHDFFTDKPIEGERCGMTDGKYSWVSSLAYYVENYNLRLPEEFENHVLST